MLFFLWLALARHSRLLASRAQTCSLLLCLPLTGTLPLDWSFLQSIAKLYFARYGPYELAAELEVPKELVDSQFKCAYHPKSTFDFLKEWRYLWIVDHGRGTSGEVLQKALARIGLYVLSDELEKKLDSHQGKESISLFQVLCSACSIFLTSSVTLKENHLI